jgi:hypothetical protein
MTKHSIGLLALVGLYSGLVSLAAGLRIGEADSALRSSPSDPSAPMVVAESTGKPPLPEMQAVGQFGQPIPDPVGRRQPGQFGGKFGGISVFQFGGQIDVAGTRHLAIEDGPVQVLAMTEAVPTAPASPAFANPKVEPGKVKWHTDFDTACKAAAKSGKPVLLFQMMGKLDDQFC